MVVSSPEVRSIPKLSSARAYHVQYLPVWVGRSRPSIVQTTILPRTVPDLLCSARAPRLAAQVANPLPSPPHLE